LNHTQSWHLNNAAGALYALEVGLNGVHAEIAKVSSQQQPSQPPERAESRVVAEVLPQRKDSLATGWQVGRLVSHQISDSSEIYLLVGENYRASRPREKRV